MKQVRPAAAMPRGDLVGSCVTTALGREVPRHELYAKMPGRFQMATTTEQMTEFAINLRLSKSASEKLVQRAAESGRDIAAVASDLIEQAITQPTVDEVLAPFRKQVAQSGMSDEGLDEFHRELLAKVRLERSARPS